MKFEEIILRKLPVYVSEAISDEFMASCELDSWQEPMLERMVFALRGFVFAEQLAEERVDVRFDETAHFDFPATPWQFFKARHWRRFPRWYRRRWPVRKHREHRVVSDIKTVTIKQFATFPMSTIKTPEKLRGPVVVRHEQVSVSD